MTLSADALGLLAAVFLACAVETVEAFTIVLAMGITRGWRSALAGSAAAAAALALITALAGIALHRYLDAALLQFIVGSLLLVFGLQWLRKAVLRAAGLKSLHDEEAVFAAEQAIGEKAGRERRLGLDWFGFVVAFKGVLLEGLEVVFIVITFGLGAARRGVPHAFGSAVLGAAAAVAVVLVAGALVRRPLSMVPENTLKFVVGLLLASFGVFWSVEGLGWFAPRPASLQWPGGDWALPGVFLGWLVVSRFTIALLRVMARREAASAAGRTGA